MRDGIQWKRYDAVACFLGTVGHCEPLVDGSSALYHIASCPMPVISVRFAPPETVPVHLQRSNYTVRTILCCKR